MYTYRNSRLWEIRPAVSRLYVCACVGYSVLGSCVHLSDLYLFNASVFLFIYNAHIHHGLIALLETHFVVAILDNVQIGSL